MSIGRARTRGAAILGAAAMVGTTLAVAPAAADQETLCAQAEVVQFADVAPDGVFADAISCLAGFGIVGGLADGTFAPARPVTRGQAAILVSNYFRAAFGSPLVMPAEQPYTDVDPDGPAGPAILRLTGAGVVAGTSPTTFDPGGLLTRGQMASIVARAVAPFRVPLSSDGANFPDVPSAGPFANAIGSLATTVPPVVGGFPDGTFRPAQRVTRGQLAQFLLNAVVLVDDRDLFSPTSPGLRGIVVSSDSGDGQLDLDTRGGAQLVDLVYDEPDDAHTVDGASADVATFRASFSPGDSLTVEDVDADGDFDRFDLADTGVPRSGTVGDVDTELQTFAIITAAGTPLRTVSYAGSGIAYTISGADVNRSTLASDLGLGDRAVLTLDGDDVTRIALTNFGYAGIARVVDRSDSAVGLRINGLGDVPTDAQDETFVARDQTTTPVDQEFRVDGRVATFEQFAADLDDTDAVEYDRFDGVEFFVLLNTA